MAGDDGPAPERQLLSSACRAAAPAASKRRRDYHRFVVGWTAGVPGAIAYATAKGALPQFTRSLARDLADYNIRVNCVAPGVIRTATSTKA